MVPFGEGNQYSSRMYESLDERRDCSSVSSLMFTLHAQAHNQVSFSARIHGFTDSQLEKADKMYNEYGPTPRICIDFVYNPDISVQYKELYAEATRGNLAYKYMDICSKGMFDMDEPSQTAYIIVPNQKETDPLVHPRLEPINLAVSTKFDRQLNEVLRVGGASRFI